MSDDPDIAAMLAPLAQAPPRSAGWTLDRTVDNLQPLVEAVRMALADSPLFHIRIDEATPEQLAEINRLRAVLVELIGPIDLRLRALDDAARIAWAKTHAKQFLVAGTKPITVEAPQTKYTIEDVSLREALLEAGVTKEEVDAAIQPYTAYKPNHRALNQLRDNRGEKVAAAIAKHRHASVPDPGRMKVTWPKPEDY